jgi:hypothetical protein
MALPLASDLADILNVNEFATAVTYRRKGALGDTTINGIFDNETIPVDMGGAVPVNQEQPRLTCRTSDVPYITETDEMIISSVRYIIRMWTHDGTGVTTIMLEKQ